MRVDDEKLGCVDGLAKVLNRSRSRVTNQAIERFLEYEEWFVQEDQVDLALPCLLGLYAIGAAVQIMYFNYITFSPHP